jgi:hypothetical protein
MLDMYLHHYKNLPRIPRNGTLYFGKKNTWARNGTVLTRPPPSLEGKWTMPTGMGKRERLELLSRAETFVSYDPATYVNEEAYLVGTKSVVEPFPGVSEEEFAGVAPAGVAYGLDDVPETQKTINLVWKRARTRLRDQNEQLDELVRRVVERWYPEAAKGAGMEKFRKERDPRAHAALDMMQRGVPW